VAFNVRVKEPQSIAGRSRNLAMDVSPIVPLTFIVLKLTGVIAWSWWWVLSPLWIAASSWQLHFAPCWYCFVGIYDVNAASRERVTS
jgi:hypothetical protein